MLKISLDRNYKAAIYLRLSKEDGDFSVSGNKLESDSISNQRLLIMEYLKTRPEITLVREYSDDGFTGANFDRPDFLKMIDAVKAGEIDCIIVKDLSRFGREYIDSGAYIEKIFPALGVRFIAINDHYDNAMPDTANNDIILPFKNLMNDSYCRDISIKVRTNLEAKRRNGQYVGSRVVFGYVKSPADKNKLVVDPEAAAIVRDIFRWKLDGLSPVQIANKLNQSKIPSPIEYKKLKGSKERAFFQTNQAALWSAVSIYRILKNEIYTGTLLQGKTTSPNHKVKKLVAKPQNEWSRTENAHEAIISASQFNLVQKIMLDDTRTPSGETGVHLFSGMIFCAECGSPLIRRVSKTKGKEYAYFICGGYKKDIHECTSHNIRESVVYDAVLAVVQAHIATVMDIAEAMSSIESLSWENREIEKINSKIAFHEETIAKNRRMKTEAYEDFKDEVITREEYKTFNAQFDKLIRESSDAIIQLTGERNSIASGYTNQQGWLGQFKKYQNITELTRSSVVSLIDCIRIRENKDIDVRLMHHDRFASIVEFLKEQKKQLVIPEKKSLNGEAV